LSGAVFALEWAPLRSNSRSQASSLQKIVMWSCSVIVKSLAALARLGLQADRRFRAALVCA
jgi:hypothetical protein